MISTGAYLAGMGYFLGTAGASLGAAWLVLRKRYGYLAGMARWLAFCTLATAAVVLVHLVPAALDVLARGSVLAAAVLCLLGAWALGAPETESRLDPVRRVPLGSRASILLAIVSVLAVASYEVTQLRYLIGRPVTEIDLLGFHLPGIARFIQTGTLWQVNQFLPGFATAQYPHNGDLLVLSMVLPWHQMAFARLPSIIFYLLTGLAVYAVAVELGAVRATAVTFTSLALAVPPLSVFALDGVPDDTALCTLTIGCLFLLRFLRTRRQGELALAGLSLGLALGAEWFGLTAAAVIVVVWLGGRLLARLKAITVLRELLTVVGMMALGGGFWLVRNLIESANPLYPKAISLFGVTLFRGSRGDVIDRFGYTIADYLGKPSILREYIYPGFKRQLGLAGVVLLVALALTLAWALAHRGEGRARPLLAGALTVIGLLIVYAITPGTAYGPKDLPIEGFVTIRWLMPAVALGGALGAAALSMAGGWAIVLELAAVVALFDAIHLSPTVPSAAAVIVGVVLTALLGGAFLLSRRRGPILTRLSPIHALALGAAGLALILVLGRVLQRHIDEHGYGPYDPVFAWIDDHAPTGSRVGLTGATGSTPGLAPVLPAFGPGLGNTVSYVGRRVVHSVELPGSIGQFRAELRRGRYNLLLIGLPYAGNTDLWARRLGSTQLARSDRLALYALPRGL